MFFLTASWTFTLAEMGVYVLAISVQWLLVALLGTGMGIAVVRLSVERFRQNDVQGAGGIAFMSAATAAAGSVLLGVVGVVAATSEISISFTPTLAALVAAWAGGRSVLECLRSSILAREEYGRAATLTMAGAVAGLSALGVVVVTGQLNLERILIAHAVGQVVSAIFAAWFLNSLWKARPTVSAVLFRSLMSYARWPTLSEGAKLLQSHVGPLILVMVASAEEAGLYGLGRYPAFVFGVVGLSLFQYWLPQAAHYGSNHRLSKFLRHHMRFAALTAVGMVVCAVLVTPLLPFLGANLGAGAYLMVPNAIDFGFVVLLLPLEAAFHGMNRPQLDTFVRVAKIPLLLTLAFLLSSRFGAAGMVWSQVITGVVALVIAFAVLKRYLIQDVEPSDKERTTK